MKRSLLLAFAVSALLTPAARADFLTTTFENLGLASDSYKSDFGFAAGQFVVDGHSFNNYFYFDEFFNAGIWSGWALSTKSSQETGLPNYDDANQYTAVGLSGHNSQGYAIVNTFTPDVLWPTTHPNGAIINLAPGSSPYSVDVNSAIYAYRSITEGDGFNAPFGPGSFLRLDIVGYDGLDGTGNIVGEIDFLLADFLNGRSLVVTDWQTLSLASLVGASSLRFGVTSSDNGIFGINTPPYAAIDNLVVSTPDVAAETPEPTALVLLAGFLGTMGVCRWKQRRGATVQCP